MESGKGRFKAAFDNPILMNNVIFIITVFVGVILFNLDVNATKIIIFISLFWLFANIIISMKIAKFKKQMTQLKTEYFKYESYSQKLSELNESVIKTIVSCAQPSVDADKYYEEVKSKMASDIEKAESFQKMIESNLEATYLGKQTIDELVSAMNDIGDGNSTLLADIETTNNEFADVLQVIKEIGGKTKMINEIVFQTKLLSFNASVEAARAGEHGKGFSVVAEEIGKLARMSGESALEISQILDKGTQRVQEIILQSKQRGQALIDKSTDNITAGTQIAKRSEAAYDGIIQSGLKTNEMSLVFSETIKDIANVIEKLREVMMTNDNVDLEKKFSNELADLMQNLNNLSSQIDTVIDQAKI